MSAWVIMICLAYSLYKADPSFPLVLGIEPLQYVFVMKFTLVDGTGVLNAYLFDYVSNPR